MSHHCFIRAGQVQGKGLLQAATNKYFWNRGRNASKTPSLHRCRCIQRICNSSFNLVDIDALKRTTMSFIGVALVAATATRILGTRSVAAASFDRVRARKYVKDGMESFVDGDVQRSLLEFDQALESDPSIEPYLWQRGLSLWLLGKYEDASIQFERDVKVNPNDVEEALWKFLSDVKLQGVAQARGNFLKVGGDARPVMKLCLKLYKDQSETPKTIFSTSDLYGDDANSFYATLYSGLWYDALGQQDKALESLAQSLKTRYAAESGDYMIAVCREAAKKINKQRSKDAI